MMDAKEDRERDLAEVWELIQELDRVSNKLRETADRAIKRVSAKNEKREEAQDD